MLSSVYDFCSGLFYSITSPTEMYYLIKNKPILYRYLKLVAINIVLLSFVNCIFTFAERLLYTFDNSLISIIYYFIFVCHGLWNIPIYIYCYLISLDSICFILDNGINVSRSRKIESIQTKIYFTIVSSIFYLSINIFNYIPYIGSWVYSMFLAYSYGFFCLEYSCYYMNISNKTKIALIENRPFFYAGYGTLYSIIVYNFSYINFFVIFTVLFPFSIMKMVKGDNFTIKTDKKYYSYIFLFPISITNILLSIIDSFIISNYRLL